MENANEQQKAELLEMHLDYDGGNTLREGSGGYCGTAVFSADAKGFGISGPTGLQPWVEEFETHIYDLCHHFLCVAGGGNLFGYW